MEETIVTADEIGMNPITNEPIVMPMDFLLIVDKRKGILEVAQTVKMIEESFKIEYKKNLK